MFTVIRGQAFAGEALGDIGAAGGSSAYLVGVAPLWGFLGMRGRRRAGVMELVGRRSGRGRAMSRPGSCSAPASDSPRCSSTSDTTHDSTTGATVSILFGSIFAIDPSMVPPCHRLGAARPGDARRRVYRPLLLARSVRSWRPRAGSTCGPSALCYLIAMALAVALSALTIGAILSTALLDRTGRRRAAADARGPAGRSAPPRLIGVGAVWLGILLAYDSYDWPPSHHGWPVSFFVVTLILLVVYLLSRAVCRRSDRR